MRNSLLTMATLMLLAPAALAATATKPDKATYATEVCSLMEAHARAHDLPTEFFTRLIWRESFFNDQAVSPVGAEGIAQFMPGTAKLRGLKDSFDFREALPASASYLGALRNQFGNLGLAAAAYNAGEDAVARWLDGRRSSLPEETQDYVLAITGNDVSDWRKPETQTCHTGPWRQAGLSLPPAAPSSCARKHPQRQAAFAAHHASLGAPNWRADSRKQERSRALPASRCSSAAC